jgi:hypothetical protein
MSVTIRPMKLEDAGKVADLSTQLGYPSAPDAIARRMGDVMQRSDGVLLVAELPTGRVAGYPFIRVTTNTARVESRPFYEALGYALFKTQYALRKTLA